MASLTGLPAGAVAASNEGTADEGFAVRINDRLVDRAITSAFVMPDEAIRVAARDLPPSARVSLEAGAAGLSARRTGDNTWRIEAPSAPGVYPIVLNRSDDATDRRLNLFVMQRFDPHTATLDGYRIGHYELEPLRGREIYEPPQALMPVTKDGLDTHLSPHFTIGQFLCHAQPGHWPKYVRVKPMLVAKLEAIVAELQRRGIKAQTLTVMSGYRTPAYNKAIGNTTTYSRHLYGGAADIYVDTNGDGRMDDLNGDGTVDVDDADWLADLIAGLAKVHPDFAGGLSAYSANSAHGPFVHTDVRGVAARW
ncbi:D-Ala-D-Ala carboxypeptidase family metallohydrolase [Salinisphaera sp. Q1T1-3]|uniref:D-Ala-D-Ala carboxypeptidase family metallohydrolase n=1 Tax=Salinisphaera sp. Q1T1-3 TaxID=2321229 RepID=UPI001F30C040|nr:D-Ala-D-Ala carboxypeptidase family metallohydrolase [Salinisphaera sp. Q1T1-3]